MDLLQEIGAAALGVAEYRVLSEHREYLDRWLSEAYEGELAYMRKHRREDPRIILPECKSLMVILFAPQKWSYHSYIRRRLKRLNKILLEYDSSIISRGVVDSAPLLERAWGVEASLGWIGKNSMLINPQLGSDFNIGVLLTSATVEELLAIEVLDHAVQRSRVAVVDGCRGCGEYCRAACPGGAIQDDRVIDSRLCHSYLSQREGWAELGCRVCQEVCVFRRV
ncbi:MAG: hypothetical protein R3Y49_04590 [Rikenellaceae bacterium]